MAQTPSTSVNHTGDGTTVLYDFPFPYQELDEVFVSVDGVLRSFVLAAGATNTLQLAVAPVRNAKIVIYRSTEAYTPKHQFVGGVPFLPRYVDENNKQMVYALQEGLADFDAVRDTAQEALDGVAAAEAAAAAAQAAAEAAAGTSNRALRVAATDPVIAPVPTVVDRAGKLLGFDATGEPVAVENRDEALYLGYTEADANLQAQINGTNPPMGSAFSEISWHGQVILNSVNIPQDKNAWSFGPTMTVAPGQVVTIGEGSVWTIAESNQSVPQMVFDEYVTGTDARLDNLEVNYTTNAVFTPFKTATETALAMKANKPLNGLDAALLGDSITAWGLYIPSMVAHTGLNVIKNVGVPGATMSMVLAQATAGNVGAAKVVNIWAGINDYFQGTALGTIADAQSGGTNTFYKHVWQVLDTVMTLNPTAKVFLIAPMQSTYNPGGFAYPAANTSGVTLDQYRIAMRTVAERLGASFIDMLAKSHFTKYNMALYTDDSIHPNTVGGAVAGKSLGILLNAG